MNYLLVLDTGKGLFNLGIATKGIGGGGHRIPVPCIDFQMAWFPNGDDRASVVSVTKELLDKGEAYYSLPIENKEGERYWLYLANL